MENKCLELIKEDMTRFIKEITFIELDIKKELLDKHFDVIKSLRELHTFKEQNNVVICETTLNEEEGEVESQINKESDDEPLKNEEVEIEESIKMVNSRQVYQFERKIVGGFIDELDTFVPEAVIRRLGVEHGDLLYAKPIESDDPYQRHFHFEIAQKGDRIEPYDRVQVNHCLVKKEAGYLVVDKSEETGEYIRYDEGLYTVVLNEYDVQKHLIKEGSLVDIAYPLGKPHLAKVIWIHKVEEVPFAETKTVTGKKKEKTEKEDKDTIEKTLSGRTVLLIGNEPKKNLYKMAVEQRGGTFLWADAKEKLNRLEPLVRKSNLVVFLLSVSGHTGMEHIKQMCKDYGIPFETTWSKGQTSFIRLTEECISSIA